MTRSTLLFGVALVTACAGWAQDSSAVASGTNLETLSIEQLMQVKVEGAALHPQALRDAPASVTIITAEDIHKYGYRTLGEALASVRGFYLNNNRTYENVGVRGFGEPGDYASHILVMVNGHTMTDNVFGFMLFMGNDFPIDMNLVKQIEIIRGPSSALYGTNGMFATINIVTKTPEEAGPAAVTATFDSFGERKGQITTATPVGKDGSLLLSGSVFNNTGESPLYFPEFDSPQTNHGEAINMNGERGYHLFANLTWHNWTITAAFGAHDQLQPVSWGATVFNNRGTQNSDVRNYIDAAYTRELRRGTLTWRTYYDEYDYTGRFSYPLGPANAFPGGVDDNREFADGTWVGSELTYRTDLGFLGSVTAGVDAKFDLRAVEGDRDVSPVPNTYLNINIPDQNLALFVQDERKLSADWTLDLGARYDNSRLLHDFLSPRIALIYQPRPAWTYKFMYGRSFRNPSLFELYYGDGLSALANPFLRPESADTVEIDAERKLGKRWNLLTAAYGYSLHNFIDGVPQAGGLIQYQNTRGLRAGGVELEVNGKLSSWLEATASYAIQRTKNEGDGTALENSPEHLAKLHFAVPLGRKFQLSSGMQYESAVISLAQNRVDGYYLADFTLTSRKLLRHFDFTLGVRNAFNQAYSVPVALNVDTMQQPGRSVFLELVPHAAR